MLCYILNYIVVYYGTIYVYVYIYVCIYVYIYMYTHIYIYILRSLASGPAALHFGSPAQSPEGPSPETGLTFTLPCLSFDFLGFPCPTLPCVASSSLTCCIDLFNLNLSFLLLSAPTCMPAQPAVRLTVCVCLHDVRLFVFVHDCLSITCECVCVCVSINIYACTPTLLELLYMLVCTCVHG